MRSTPLKTRFLMACMFGVNLLLNAQISPDCQTAIPICSNTPINGGTSGYGIDDFGGASSTGCLEPTLSGFIESNSAWYRFRTGASGQLGFNISFDAAEDWDFALYRASDCGSLGDPIRCNFFDNRDGEQYMGVGEDPTGNPDTFLYEPWLEVAPGEDYYLLINNFSNTNSGFSIQFSGEIFTTNPNDALDCSIISNLLGPPVAACDGDAVPLDATTTGAVSYQWFADTGSGYQPLTGEVQPTYWATTAAMYRVQVGLPDGSQIISDVQVGFSPSATTYPLTDIAACGAAPVIDLEAKDLEALGPQDPDQFRVSYHSSLTDAQAGIHALPKTLSLAPGLQTIYVRTTSLANPACFDAMESFQAEAVADPVLDFEQQAFICADGGSTTIGPSPEAGVSYLWDTGETTAQLTVTAPGIYTLSATVSGAGIDCRQERSVEVLESTPPQIQRIDIEDVRANNRVTVVPVMEGPFEYALDDGDFQESPVFEGVTPGLHQLRMRDRLGCGEVSETITVVGYPPFFSPNGDGLNDHWEVSGLEELTDPVLHIFDRYGKLLHQMDLQSNQWDGTYNGRPLPASDYWFRLSYTDPRGARVEARFLNAHFSLKR